MKRLAVVLLAIAGLSGCVAYPVESGHPYGGYQYGGYRDRDRDGIANRMDRDRDGDGVRNRYDRYPDNPRRH